MNKATLRRLRRPAALVLGLVVLAVLLNTADWRRLGEVISAADPRRLLAALALFIPQVAVMAWRWQVIGATARRFSFLDSARMVLAGSALNVLLPSKLGDLSKGLMLGSGGEADHARGLGLAGLDKLLDVLGLAVVLVVAGAVAPNPEPGVLLIWMAAVAGVVALCWLLHRVRPIAPLPRRKALAALARALNAAVEVRARRAAWFGALGLSLLLWTLHVGQIHIFYSAVGTRCPAAAVWSRVPMGIFIGLLPLTVAGIGTRDAAFFVLMAPWDSRAVIAWLGLFCTLRYVVMTLLGVPAIVSLGSGFTAALRRRAHAAPDREGR